MKMICEKCGKSISASEGEYLFYRDKMLFACKVCAKRLNDEMKVARQICAAIDGKKTQAERIANSKEAFDKLLKNIEATLKKIPGIGNLLSDIPLLASFVKSYIIGEYKEIPFNSIVAAIATLLYVVTPIDIIPDAIPGIGYTDDAMAVAFCIKMIHDDLEKYKAWRDKRTDDTMNEKHSKEYE